jgi:hydroxymethylglutaryl-CoA reductase
VLTTVTKAPPTGLVAETLSLGVGCPAPPEAGAYTVMLRVFETLFRPSKAVTVTVKVVSTAGLKVCFVELPLAVGIVGGATKVHPTARVALKVVGVKTARELAEVMAAVGLAQNLAALRALATEGIQRGHMALHARQMAIAAGATGELVDVVAARLVREKRIRLDRAGEILREVQGAST